MKSRETERPEVVVAQCLLNGRVNGEHLRKTRAAYKHDLGDWFIVNSRNTITARHVTLAGLARELGVLRPYEELDA